MTPPPLHQLHPPFHIVGTYKLVDLNAHRIPRRLLMLLDMHLARSPESPLFSCFSHFSFTLMSVCMSLFYIKQIGRGSGEEKVLIGLNFVFKRF